MHMFCLAIWITSYLEYKCPRLGNLCSSASCLCLVLCSGFSTIWGSTIGALGFAGIMIGFVVWLKNRYFHKLKKALPFDEDEAEDYKELQVSSQVHIAKH